MNDWRTGLVLVLCALAGVATIVEVVRDQPAGDRIYALLAVIEVALIVQLVLGALRLSGSDSDVSGLLFISYLVAVLLVLPLGAIWSLAERTRAGTGVLLLAVLTVAGLELRLNQIWAGAGA